MTVTNATIGLYDSKTDPKWRKDNRPAAFIDVPIAAADNIFFFCNPILFAICTSTFSKLCKLCQ
jgi:hypothetical protein